jgi:hypothetical protein
MQSSLFVVLAVVLGGCGSQFQGVVDDSTLPDAGSLVPEVDAAPTPLEAGADVRADGHASGSVEASTDAAAPDVAPPMGPDAGSDAVSDAADGADAPWPSDVVVEPWCPDSELFPTYSVTCDTWGQAHGWTLPGCCLPDHTCGTAYGSPRSCHR